MRYAMPDLRQDLHFISFDSKKISNEKKKLKEIKKWIKKYDKSLYAMTEDTLLNVDFSIVIDRASWRI